MQNMSKAKEEGVDNPVDNVDKTSGKPVENSARKTIMHLVMSGLAGAGIAVVHAFFTELEGCQDFTANPETAGVFGASIRAIILSMKSGGV